MWQPAFFFFFWRQNFKFMESLWFCEIDVVPKLRIVIFFAQFNLLLGKINCEYKLILLNIFIERKCRNGCNDSKTQEISKTKKLPVSLPCENHLICDFIIMNRKHFTLCHYRFFMGMFNAVRCLFLYLVFETYD